MAEKYLLRVTAGPSKDESSHVVVPVNTEKAISITSDFATTKLVVRVQNFRGIPRKLPTTSPYFDHDPHTHDQYSISFSFVPHASVSGADLVFGNDFDRPIASRLPPGFNYAFSIVKRFVDPGLEGDVYADKPYLYGPALSSLNVLQVGGKANRDSQGNWDLSREQDSNHGQAIEEGADEEGEEARDESECPEDADGRKAWALRDEKHREQWQWEAGRIYRADFFNAYLDFNTFSLKLPLGFSLGVLPHLDEKDSLRYVLKDRKTDQVYFVILFTLVLREDLPAEERDTPERESNAAGYEPQDDDLD